MRQNYTFIRNSNADKYLKIIYPCRLRQVKTNSHPLVPSLSAEKKMLPVTWHTHMHTHMHTHTLHTRNIHGICFTVFHMSPPRTRLPHACSFAVLNHVGLTRVLKEISYPIPAAAERVPWLERLDIQSQEKISEEIDPLADVARENAL